MELKYSNTFAKAHVCASCGARDSPLWRPDEATGMRCYTCSAVHMMYGLALQDRLQVGSRDETDNKACGPCSVSEMLHLTIRPALRLHSFS